MKLNYRTLGAGEPLIIMHGVFGSADNWQSVGKVLSECYKLYLVDLRNHGSSPHSEEFTYEAMAKDVVELMDDENISRAHILGHSMGGKVAMHLATQFSKRVDKLIVVDIAPKYYPPHHQQIFEGFHAVDLDSLETRKDADEQMGKVIHNFGVRQFILKNLNRTKEGNFEWKLNLPVIEKAIENVGKAIEDEVSFDGPTLFLGGAKSDYITAEDHELIRLHFSSATIVMIKDAGHWVHAEQPEALVQSVTQFLQA